MLSKLIVSSFHKLIELLLWVSLALFAIMGAVVAGGVGGFWVIGLIIGAIVWFVLAVLSFGALLLLLDIRELVRKIEARKT